MSGGRDDGEPMMEMNTTPLIDVMLVLLIMFIITIPIQTHAVKIDLPQNAPTPPDVVDPVRNKLAIDAASQITWNGSPIDKLTLRQYLDASLRLPVEPELQFAPDKQTRYVTVDEVLAVIKQSGVTKLGFVGNEQYRSFQ
ncbi:biopolymer transport protein ExbD [Sphingobium subterraneum]|uniref:Biopolymer transport protein ExbD n=2 Tax=Sphingobium subterraneum TaxID=627688 RepID=A0A841J0H4_9SPHN|nr:biopolymer transport protein ExbD [Sphingobium subterraneum]